jgi:ElaB/YqjD/DUF883 family membrane-anchored ribosome-binding protein
MAEVNQEIKALADAMWQLLDDMGKNGQSVCLQAKAEARMAFEPFRDKDEGEFDSWMSIADAKAVIDDAERKR